MHPVPAALQRTLKQTRPPIRSRGLCIEKMSSQATMDGELCSTIIVRPIDQRLVETTIMVAESYGFIDAPQRAPPPRSCVRPPTPAEPNHTLAAGALGFFGVLAVCLHVLLHLFAR